MRPSPATRALVRPRPSAAGRVRVPGDKSISHRYALLAALADGDSTDRRLFAPAPTAPSTAALPARASASAIDVAAAGRRVAVDGRGLRGPGAPRRRRSTPATPAPRSGCWRHPRGPPVHGRRSTGDASLRRRPMRRVIEPLERDGRAHRRRRRRPPPLTIDGGRRCTAIDYAPAVPSAQVKSAVLLAGLHADGVTPRPRAGCRRAIIRNARCGVRRRASTRVGRGHRSPAGSALAAPSAAVPGDVSSAAFWAVAAAGLPGSEVDDRARRPEPVAHALFDVLRRAGAIVEVTRSRRPSAASRAGRVRRPPRRARARSSIAPDGGAGRDRRTAGAGGARDHSAASCTSRGAAELRVKESDRITRARGRTSRRSAATIEELPDGFHVTGRAPPGRRRRPTRAGDHRLAMAFAIAALGAERPSTHHRRRRGRRVVPGLLRHASSRLTAREGRQDLSGRLHGRRQDDAWPARSARRLGWRADDIDELIEARERRTVADIFARERRAVLPRGRARRCCSTCCPLRHAVVATGGGTFVDPENRAAINRDGTSVWLDVPLAELDRARAGRRAPAAGRGPRAVRAAVRAAPGGVRSRRTCASTRARAPVEALVERLHRAALDELTDDALPGSQRHPRQPRGPRGRPRGRRRRHGYDRVARARRHRRLRRRPERAWSTACGRSRPPRSSAATTTRSRPASRTPTDSTRSRAAPPRGPRRR